MAENNKDYLDAKEIENAFSDGNYDVKYSDGKWSINGYALCPDSVEPATDAENMQYIVQQNHKGVDYILKQAENLEPGENGCIFDSFGDFWSVAVTEQYSLENGENGFDFRNQSKQGGYDDIAFTVTPENIDRILSDETGWEGLRESARTIQNPIDTDFDASLDSTYSAYGQSPYEATKDKGFGEDTSAIFVCKGDSPDAIKNGYRALLAYQEDTKEDACMIVDRYIGVPGNRQFTDNGVLDYMSTMRRHFREGWTLFPTNKEEAWYKCCNEQMNNGTNGCNLENATDIAVALAVGQPFDEVARKLNNMDFADGSKDDVMSIVTEFAPKGQDFADYLQQSGHGTKGRGNEDIVKDSPNTGKDDYTPGDN